MGGLKRLNNGRATGSVGLPAELLRYAQAPATAGEPAPPHVLAPVVLDVLNAAFRVGEVPAEVNVGVVYKKGDACDIANYRRIAVTLPIVCFVCKMQNN